MKDHEFRELVNSLRDVAVAYHAHESLRERIRRALSDALKRQEPVAWTTNPPSGRYSMFQPEVEQWVENGWNIVPLYAAPVPHPERSAYRYQALDDVIAERRRQIEVEGWTPEHDDHHSNGEMSLAAGLYAISAGFATKYLNGETKTCPVPDGWPWAEAWWKPVNARRDLVKSVALGLAEIERMDRAERSAGDEREGE